MANSVAHQVGRLRALVPDLLTSTSFSARLQEGVVHARRSSWYACGGTPTEVTLADLRPATTCDNCLRAHNLSSLVPAGGLLAALIELAHQKKRSDALDALSSTLLRQRDTHQKAHRKLQGELEGTDLTDGDEELVKALVESSTNSLARLTTLLRAGVNATPHLGAAKGVFLNGRIGSRSSDYQFDDTPTLVGISPFRPEDWTGDQRRLFESFALRHDATAVVLELPRYAADAFLASAPLRRVHPTTSAHDMDYSQLDTAAALWEPGSDGPYSSLHASARAARALGAAGA